MWKDDLQARMGYDSLVLNIADGHITYLTDLYLALKKPIYACALSIVRNCYTAEDIMQETFLRVTTHAETYRRGTNAKAWIFTIVRNLSITELRRQSRTSELNDAVRDPRIPMEDMVDSALDYLNMLKILETQEREIITLHLAAGMRFTVIAKILKLSPSNIRSKYFRALAKLRNKAEKE